MPRKHILPFKCYCLKTERKSSKYSNGCNAGTKLPPFPEGSTSEGLKGNYTITDHTLLTILSLLQCCTENRKVAEIFFFSEHERCTPGPEQHLLKLVPNLIYSVYAWCSCRSSGYHTALIPQGDVPCCSVLLAFLQMAAPAFLGSWSTDPTVICRGRSTVATSILLPRCSNESQCALCDDWLWAMLHFGMVHSWDPWLPTGSHIREVPYAAGGPMLFQGG